MSCPSCVTTGMMVQTVRKTAWRCRSLQFFRQSSGRLCEHTATSSGMTRTIFMTMIMTLGPLWRGFFLPLSAAFFKLFLTELSPISQLCQFHPQSLSTETFFWMFLSKTRTTTRTTSTTTTTALATATARATATTTTANNTHKSHRRRKITTTTHTHTRPTKKKNNNALIHTRTRKKHTDQKRRMTTTTQNVLDHPLGREHGNC